jgi:hypothetical protein
MKSWVHRIEPLQYIGDIIVYVWFVAAAIAMFGIGIFFFNE